MLWCKAIIWHVDTCSQHAGVVTAYTVIACRFADNVGSTMDIHDNRISFQGIRYDQCSEYPAHVHVVKANTSRCRIFC
ncbi:hypothetical protein D1872_323660 [compost metagenome]